MVTQIINFGLPAPIDVQIDGPTGGQSPRAEQMLNEFRRVRAWWISGSSSLRLPKFDVAIDRTKRARAASPRETSATAPRVAEREFQTTPTFFLTGRTG